MKGDNRRRSIILFEALIREFNWRFCKHNIFVTEYPKSGASWFCQMLSELTQYDYCRNRVPGLNGCIIQGHRLSNAFTKNKKLFLMIRDGRDVAVSAYYYFLFKNDRNNHKYVDTFIKKSKINIHLSIKENLPSFIDYIFCNKLGIINYGNWATFNESWFDKLDENYIIKYENLKNDPLNELLKVCDTLKITDKVGDTEISNIINKYDISNQQISTTDSHKFIRKGIVGDWKNHFSEEAKDVFKKHAGEHLIMFGYENNLDW